MGLFDKLFGGSKDKGAVATIEAPPCPHTVLVPRWDAAEDIGREDRASFFICEGCHESFTPEEARKLRESMAERLAEITAEAPASDEEAPKQ
jgi:hypothetical protein